MSRLNCVFPSFPSQSSLCAAVLLSPPCRPGRTSRGCRWSWASGATCATVCPDSTRRLGSPLVTSVPAVASARHRTGAPSPEEPGPRARSRIHPSIPRRPRLCDTGRCREGDPGTAGSTRGAAENPWGGKSTGSREHPPERGHPARGIAPTAPAAGGSRRLPRSLSRAVPTGGTGIQRWHRRRGGGGPAMLGARCGAGPDSPAPSPWSRSGRSSRGPGSGAAAPPARDAASPATAPATAAPGPGPDTKGAPDPFVRGLQHFAAGASRSAAPRLRDLNHPKVGGVFKEKRGIVKKGYLGV